MKFIVSYRYGTISREIINPKPVEWCDFVNGDDPNPFVKMIFDVIRDSSPQLFHSCPYDVSF